MIAMETLWNLNRPECIAVTEHARLRLLERGIAVKDIISCIASGRIIKQYEDDKPFPSCLLMGKDENGQVLHAVISHDGEYLHLITAYYPNRDLWEADLQTRKGRS